MVRSVSLNKILAATCAVGVTSLASASTSPSPAYALALQAQFFPALDLHDVGVVYCDFDRTIADFFNGTQNLFYHRFCYRFFCFKGLDADYLFHF
jgi:hypothetical protein